MWKRTSDSDDSFQALGPKHLTPLDWSNLDHQRSIMACMVQGAYMVEKERSKKLNHILHASDWWENFHYELVDNLIDEHDHSIYGIVLQLKPSNTIYSQGIAPRIVVAFRGTMLDTKHGLQDGILDLYVCIGGLEKRSRIKNAIKKVEKLVDKVGSSNVWLTGHSLGAATVTVIGKYMVKETDFHLNTFLFNPPFAKIPLDLMPFIDERVKEKIHKTKTYFRATKAIFSGNSEKSHNINDVAKLSSWIPNIFVHFKDPICMEYINHFKRIKDLVKIRDCPLTQLVTPAFVREKLSNVVSDGVEMSHILPSASLRVNHKELDHLLKSHKISLWWQSDLQLMGSECFYKSEVETTRWYELLESLYKSEMKKLGLSDLAEISEIGDPGNGSWDQL